MRAFDPFAGGAGRCWFSSGPLGAHIPTKEDHVTVDGKTAGIGTMNETELERERFFSRLSTIPGVDPMPSIRDWILIKTENPQDLARRVNRRLAPGTVSVPRHVSGAVRIPVRDPKWNQSLFHTIRDLMNKLNAAVGEAADSEGDEPYGTADVI